jgi:hypothetical protein
MSDDSDYREFERIGIFETWPVEFRRDGNLVLASQVDELVRAAGSATDMLVISHGWNNDEREASLLYRELLGNLSQQTTASAPGRRLIVLRVYWPSKRFADEDLIPGGAASATDPVQSVSAQLDALLSDFKFQDGLLTDLRSPEARARDAVQRDALGAMQKLLLRLDEDPEAQEEFVRLSRLLLSTSHVNDEEEVLQQNFYASDGPEVLQRLSRKFKPKATPVEGPTSIGGTEVAGMGDEGGAAGLGNVFRGPLNGARNLLNLFTYFEMKERAGTVGSTGLADVLRRVTNANPKMRIHLCGHSFGGRLVVAALAARPPAAEATDGVRSVVLLQAAFSHNALGVKYDGQRDGYFRRIFEGNRLFGPIVITHTERDWSVGLAYPIASRLRNQVASGLGDANDAYGAIGRNGALFVSGELDKTEATLHPLGEPYAKFKTGRVYNLHGGSFITGHGTVRGREVAQALRHALDASVD